MLRSSATAPEYAPPQPLILLVNHEPAEQLRLRVTLEREGYCVLSATAAEADSVLRIVTPRVILIDVEGSSDPLALIRSLKRSAGARTRVVALTSDARLGLTMSRSKRHCAGVLAKPLDLCSVGEHVSGYVA